MSNKIVDLRSDTVTKPSPEMWEVLRSLDDSSLGDDVIREDPTVNELEATAAKITGKEAALLVSSGTQGNLVSLLSSTRPGDEILLEAMSHILYYEVGSAARVGGLTPRPYFSNKGIASLETDLQPLIRPRNDDHQPWTTLVCVENTHNNHGGTILPPTYLSDLNTFAQKNENMRIHMDGARIFNAAVAMKLPVTDFTVHVDSMSFCLSKGLSCPVGSIVVGSQGFIDKARKNRKMLGGGMRQAGIIAVFGLVALEDKWIKRLEEDHINAKHLARGLKELELPIIVDEPETNIIFVECPINTPMEKLVNELSHKGILTFNKANKLRLVTHYGITAEDIAFCIEQFPLVLKEIFA
ncbi:MAG: DegT/DnrJ/EryC1/StrS family aminotransferase [Candidatus Heimdallarchaeota archaeon]|nr:MAG: DegT/DnrJ/EryC1/StrS family aminotransferase [Candidatus Heimdallarchaeota archaeon]